MPAPLSQVTAASVKAPRDQAKARAGVFAAGPFATAAFNPKEFQVEMLRGDGTPLASWHTAYSGQQFLVFKSTVPTQRRVTPRVRTVQLLGDNKPVARGPVRRYTIG